MGGIHLRGPFLVGLCEKRGLVDVNGDVGWLLLLFSRVEGIAWDDDFSSTRGM